MIRATYSHMSEPIRILFTIPNFITAGSGRAMLNIIERLDRKRFEPAVCVSRKGGRLDSEVEKLEIPFIEASFTVPARPYLSLPFRVWKAARVFRPYGFELWHSFHYADDYTEPLIARLSGAKAWVYTKKNMNWCRRSWRLRTLLATRVAAQNTDMLREFFGSRRGSRKARLVQRGVDTHQFSPILDAQGLRGRLDSAGDALVAVCVAQLLPVKGHPTLLHAIARVPGLELLIAGDPLDEDYASSLKKLTAELGIQNRVRFLGGVGNVPELLPATDFFVLPTWGRWRMEGCPVALLEAMSCGKACIATDIPGARDIIEDGKSGLLVPPEDATALAEAIALLSSSPELRRSLGVAARKRIEEKFSIEREVADHEALYTGIFPRVSSNPGQLRTELSSQLLSM
jgi:glycosyltransferase involved in cell wall biosynthesis